MEIGKKKLKRKGENNEELTIINYDVKLQFIAQYGYLRG